MARRKARGAGKAGKAEKTTDRRRRVWEVVTFEELDAWRKSQNMPKIGLAHRLGVTNSTIHNWARGVAVATPNTQRKLRRLIDSNPPGSLTGPSPAPRGRRGARAAARGAGPATSGPSPSEAIAQTAAEIVSCYLQTKPGIAPDRLAQLVREVREALTS